jgi:transposase
MDGPMTKTQVEVITSVERRRRWSREEKLRIVAETARPEATVSQVARAHGITPGQLFTWRRQLLAAAIGTCEAESGFVPVRVTADAAAAMPAQTGQRIDIRLPSGIVVSVGADVEVEALRRALTALAGR